jgi:hypothetical protein
MIDSASTAEEEAELPCCAASVDKSCSLLTKFSTAASAAKPSEYTLTCCFHRSSLMYGEIATISVAMEIRATRVTASEPPASATVAGGDHHAMTTDSTSSRAISNWRK